jgi:hypothetical protein
MEETRGKGRPTKYLPEMCDKADEYLLLNQDEEVEMVNNKGTRVKVKLPTVEGFALFLGVNKTTLYEWDKSYPEFSNSLNKIVTEQKKRLLNKGLEGTYNSTIAKLILSANHGMREGTDVTSGNKPIPLLNYATRDNNSNTEDTESKE